MHQRAPLPADPSRHRRFPPTDLVSSPPGDQAVNWTSRALSSSRRRRRVGKKCQRADRISYVGHRLSPLSVNRRTCSVALNGPALHPRHKRKYLSKAPAAALRVCHRVFSWHCARCPMQWRSAARKREVSVKIDGSNIVVAVITKPSAVAINLPDPPFQRPSSRPQRQPGPKGKQARSGPQPP